MSRILAIGATSAIASEMLRRFAKDNNQIFLLGRTQTKLDQLDASLAVPAIGKIAFDFNDTATSEGIVKQVYAEMGGIDLVLVAHGYIGDQIRSEADYAHTFEIIQTNFLSVLALLIPLSKLMEKAGQGKIAVMTSVAGDRGRPRNYTYGCAKGAMDLYLQGLRSTLWKSGVEVYSFKLGPVDSPMTIDHTKNFSFSSINRVTEIMLTALNSKRYTRYVPGYWFWVMWTVRWLPESIFQKIGFLSNR